MVAESWPTDYYSVLADSKLSPANRRTALVLITFIGRNGLKCEPPFKMLKIEGQASSSDSVTEIWTAQMCGISKWGVGMANGGSIPTVVPLK